MESSDSKITNEQELLKEVRDFISSILTLSGRIVGIDKKESPEINKKPFHSFQLLPAISSRGETWLLAEYDVPASDFHLLFANTISSLISASILHREVAVWKAIIPQIRHDVFDYLIPIRTYAEIIQRFILEPNNNTFTEINTRAKKIEQLSVAGMDWIKNQDILLPMEKRSINIEYMKLDEFCKWVQLTTGWIKDLPISTRCK